MDKTSSEYRFLLIYVVLILATVIAFEQVRHNDFVNYDDDKYVTENLHVNGGITLKSVVWAFTTTHTSNWHPLTWLSHMLDCQLFGLAPGWHHLMSLLFHIANTLLLFWVLKRMTGAVWASALVAGAFALHPLHVESVAWISERKDVLSTLFWMLTIAAYIRYAQRPDIGRYLLVVLAFGLGLMAKPMLVTLPFVLLLLDYWPLGRLQLGRQSEEKTLSQSESVCLGCHVSSPQRLIAEKIPFFVLVVVSSVITFIASRSGGAVAQVEYLPPSFRIANALASYISYFNKMIYPSKLAIFYPHPGYSLSALQAIVCFIKLAAVSAVVIYMARRRRYLIVGWLWYLGTLVPVIGLVQVGAQAMADRYTYLPSIGIFIMVAWGAAELFSKWRYRKIGLGVSAGLLLTVLLICTRMQVRHWQNTFTLFGHARKVTRSNPITHNNYGYSLLERGQLDEAIREFREALRLEPKHSKAHNNLGKVLIMKNKISEAIEEFREAVRLKPDFLKAYNNLGLAYARLGKYELAMQNFNEALKLEPDNPYVYYNMALAMSEQGQYDQAIEHFNKTLRAKPDWPDAHYNLGNVYYQQGRLSLAIAHWLETIKSKPDSAKALNSLAWVLAATEDTEVQNPADAVKFAERACELTNYKNPGAMDTLAVAYAAVGKFDQAIETAEKAIELALSAGKKDIAQEIQNRLQLYKASWPYREK